MKDHTQAGSVKRDAAEEIAGAGKRKKSVDEADEIASQRETQPK